jgi:hypothetical protein
MASGLHPNEKRVFPLAGKPYIWVRVNGQLQARSALDAQGRMTDQALARMAGEDD